MANGLDPEASAVGSAAVGADPVAGCAAGCSAFFRRERCGFWVSAGAASAVGASSTRPVSASAETCDAALFAPVTAFRRERFGFATVVSSVFSMLSLSSTIAGALLARVVAAHLPGTLVRRRFGSANPVHRPIGGDVAPCHGARALSRHSSQLACDAVQCCTRGPVCPVSLYPWFRPERGSER
nr:hypothetical protein [Pseudolysinimonas kribbensis]